MIEYLVTKDELNYESATTVFNWLYRTNIANPMQKLKTMEMDLFPTLKLKKSCKRIIWIVKNYRLF